MNKQGRPAIIALIVAASSCGGAEGPTQDAGAGGATTTSSSTSTSAVVGGGGGAGGSGSSSSSSSASSSSGASSSSSSSGAPGPCGQGALCDGVSGLCAPAPACSPASPCSKAGGGQLTTSFDPPVCKTSVADHPAFDDGPPRLWTDVNGDPRGACVHRPAGVLPRPLIVFLHGASGSARGVYDHTLLREKSDTYSFYATALPKGFILAADQGRNLPGYGIYPNGKPGHDHLHRDLGSPSQSPDVRSLDRLIDELVAEGGVDTQRIYVVGWSNGGFFAHMYGVARHVTKTPGGHNVRAVASFASGDPFENANATEDPSCKVSQYPTTLLPIGLVHRSCDSFVGCDVAQAQKFGLDPGYDVSAWATTAKTVMADPNVAQVIIDKNSVPVSACTPAALCTAAAGTINHLAWPDGIHDGSGVDGEVAILQFLKDH